MEKENSTSKLKFAFKSALEKGNVVAIRNHVMAGGFHSLPTSVEWRTPSFKLLVFVSSTFTDTQKERDFLMDELLFELRSLASEHSKLIDDSEVYSQLVIILFHCLMVYI